MIDRMRSSFAPRTAVFAALLLLAAALGAQAPAAPGTQTPAAQRQEQAPFARNQEWKTYSFPADGFSASYPSEPAMQKKNISTDAGSFELRAYLAEDPPAVMFIGVCDYGAAVAGRNPETVLEGAQKGAIANVSGHLVSGEKITLGVYPGVAFETENETLHFSARAYLVGTTLYQTILAYPIGKPYEGTTRFLDSFQLIARVSGAATP